MHIQDLLHHFGYQMLFIGTLLEGETIVVLAGYLAHQGVFHLVPVILLSFLGTYIIDQVLFFVGYYQGARILRKFPQDKVQKVQNLIRRYDSFYIILFRFLYGLRTISPIIIGSSKVRIAKFMVLNFASAFVWAVAFAELGYAFGNITHGLIRRVEIEIAFVLLFVLSVIFLKRKFFKEKPKPEL